MGKLIYAILSGKPGSEMLKALFAGMKKGIAETELAVVSSGQISAVVSDIVKADLVANQANAITFADVIEILAQQYTLLPMRFGSVMESADSVSMMLERNYEEIQKNLQKVENKVEYGLKIFCNSEKLREQIKPKSEELILSPGKPDSETSNHSIYRDYVNNKLKEHRLEELLLAYIDSVIAQITEKINQLSAVLKFKKIVTETTIIDAVFLLDKEQENNLIQAIDDFKNQFNALNFVLTGPWPPYNFVETTIKLPK